MWILDPFDVWHAERRKELDDARHRFQKLNEPKNENEGAEPCARANDHAWHVGCGAALGAKHGRGSALTFGKKSLIRCLLALRGKMPPSSKPKLSSVLCALYSLSSPGFSIYFELTATQSKTKSKQLFFF